MRHTERQLLCSALLCSASALTLGSVSACRTRAEPSEKQDQNQKLTGAVDQATLSDFVSPPPVILRWRGGAEKDSSAAVSSLEVEIDNTIDADVDVTFAAVGQGPERDVSTVLDTVAVPAKGKQSHSIGVDTLPVQLVDGSVTTIMSAEYTGPDGRQYTSMLPTRWITHESGYGKARVRTATAEARANAAKSLKDLFRPPAMGRQLDSDKGRFVDLAAPSGATPSRFVTFASASLPEPGDGDLSRRFPEEDSDEPVEKGGNYDICFWVSYKYVDANMGEDRLKDGVYPTTIGHERARYMYARLCDTSGVCLYDYLNSSGCTGPVPHPNGTYTASLRPEVYGGRADDMYVSAFNTTAEMTANQYTWSVTTYTVAGSGGTISVYPPFNELLNVILPTSLSVWLMPPAFRQVPTNYHNFLLDEEAQGGGVGTSGYVTLLDGHVWEKYPVLHEFGHRVQSNLFGGPAQDYGEDAVEPWCNCDHVDAGGINLSHCLQSRERSFDAQVEGFADFFASDVLNVWSQSDCAFVNFKATYDELGIVHPSPYSVSCKERTRWMARHCATAGKGTELDWMNFYWYLNNKVDFSYGDFETVYEQACGGTCDLHDDDELSWANLLSAVQAKSPSDLGYWTDAGGFYGVDF